MDTFLRLGEKLSKITLLGIDISEYTIVYQSKGGLRTPPVIDPTKKKAAEILQSYIFKITDILIPIFHDNYPLKTENEILIGGTNRTVMEDFSDEEYIIKTTKDSLIIDGGIRGILYGVYSFIEKYLNVRYFTKDCEKIIYRENYIIGDIDERFEPIFEYRELCDWNAWDADFSVKNKLNGTFVRQLSKEDGYGVGFAGGFSGLVHTFEILMPPDKYLDSHPEYYALNGNTGERDPMNLCFSQEVVKEISKNAIQMWLSKEEAPELISISINDVVATPCMCDSCKHVYEKGGNFTDALILFVNDVAAEIAEHYPKIKVDTIAYSNAYDLPIFARPSDNVIIRVCARGTRELTFEQSYSKYTQTQDKRLKEGHDFYHILKKWGEIAKYIIVWDYPYNYKFVNSIFPVIDTLLPNKDFFAKNNVRGVYINGQTDGSELYDLRVYLTAKAMWNPQMSQDEFDTHKREFLQGFFGAGWQYIDQYINLTKELSKDTYFNIESLPQQIIPLKIKEDGLPDLSFVDKANSLFLKAASLAETDGEKRRIKKTKLSVDYYELYATMDIRMEKSTDTDKQDLIKRNQQMHHDLIKHGIPRVVENGFLPVIKDFRQSPTEWLYWCEEKGSTGDVNNENYDRELYLLLPSNKPKGTKLDFTMEYRTGNTHEDGYLYVFNGQGFHQDEQKSLPKWPEYRQHRTIHFKDAVVTDVAEISKVTGIDVKDIRLNLIKPYHRGVVIKVAMLDAGSYVSAKNMQGLLK